MLMRVLQEIESAQGPVSLDEMSRRLGIESDVLEGMLQALVRMGRLRDDSAVLPACDLHCAGCRAAQLCSLSSQRPRTYSVVTRDNQIQGVVPCD